MVEQISSIYFENNNKRRKTSAPCSVCLEKIEDDQEIIYCFVCGEQYHKTCWIKNSNQCRVYGCYGRTHNSFWTAIELLIFGLLGGGRSKLLKKCSNCNSSISPIDRYCDECGYDVNRPESQNSFKYYGLFIFLRKMQRPTYAMAFSIGMLIAFFICILPLISLFNDSINGETTDNTPTFTLRPNTPTLTQTDLPTSTFTLTATLAPTLTRTPTFTPTPTSSRVPLPQPTRTRDSDDNDDNDGGDGGDGGPIEGGG